MFIISLLVLSVQFFLTKFIASPAVAIGFAIKGTVLVYLVNLPVMCFGCFNEGWAKTQLILAVIDPQLPLALPCSITAQTQILYVWDYLERLLVTLSYWFKKKNGACFTESMIQIPSSWAVQALKGLVGERDTEDTERRRQREGMPWLQARAVAACHGFMSPHCSRQCETADGPPVLRDCSCRGRL